MKVSLVSKKASQKDLQLTFRFFKDTGRFILHSQYLVDTQTPFALTGTKSDLALIGCGPVTIFNTVSPLSNADVMQDVYHLHVNYCEVRQRLGTTDR